MSNDSSSPSATDFAFEPPSGKMSTTGIYNNMTPMNGGNNSISHFYNGMPYSAYSTGSSFSSTTSGSIGGGSFSSAEALPAISRDFVKPAPSETRRPATAGGALQSRSPFGGFLGIHQDKEKDTIIEENGAINGNGNGTGISNAMASWMNPFENHKSIVSPVESNSIDPRYIPSNRRSSEGTQQASGSMPPPSWPTSNSHTIDTSSTNSVSPVYPMSSAPANTTNFNIYQNLTPNIRSGVNNSSQILRPQTSDGLPSFGGPTTLPSARSVVGSVDGFNPMSTGGLAPAANIRNSFDSFRDRMSGANSRSDGELTFVPLGGPAPKKRPRRRYDEIERLYICGWNGCEKSYGTLNHLNAHVAMQKHGEKRLPQEFKDMRKAWRKKKREAAASGATGSSNNHYQNPSNGWRSSISSESDLDRRDSMLSSGSSRFPGTTPSVYSYDSRPTTADSMISTNAPITDGRFNNISAGLSSYGFNGNASSIPNFQVQGGSRRSSMPQHISMPSQPIGLGFRQNEDGPTPTQQNPFPIQNGMVQAQRMYQQQQQQMPQQFQAQQMRPMSSGGLQTIGSDHGFPFQTLTQPMHIGVGGGGQQYGQFAFQR